MNLDSAHPEITGIAVSGRLVAVPTLKVIPPLDFASGEDLAVARRRQTALNARGERLVVDGLIGPSSIAAARRQGFARWRDVV